MNFLLLCLLWWQSPVEDLKGRIATVDFFGGPAQPAPVKRGDPAPTTGTGFGELRKRIREATGATDVSLICCDTPTGGWNIFVSMVKPVEFKPRAGLTKPLRLPKEILDAYDAFIRELPGSLQRGGLAKEDHSLGYALSADPVLRKTQDRMREVAVTNPAVLIAVLDGAADEQQRLAAAHVLGYAQKSDAQLEALVRALNDPHETVRNNATRAIAVLVASDAAVARKIPFSLILDRLKSHVWSDRNKALMLLARVTESRDPVMLQTLKQHALVELMEMARWNSRGHRATPITLLGRIAGLPEDEIGSYSAAGDSEPVLRLFQ